MLARWRRFCFIFNLAWKLGWRHAKAYPSPRLNRQESRHLERQVTSGVQQHAKAADRKRRAT